jgi:hypothetical protein
LPIGTNPLRWPRSGHRSKPPFCPEQRCGLPRAWLPIEVIHRGCTRVSVALFTGRDNIAGCTVTTS